jgi:NADPH:quinone reductase-like Zn-dependent oxidoreductase
MTNSKKIKVLNGIINYTTKDVNFLKTLIELDQFKPVIDRMYSLEEMAEAHIYAEKGLKKGNVFITIWL